jgi:hypothetical protein
MPIVTMSTALARPQRKNEAVTGGRLRFSKRGCGPLFYVVVIETEDGSPDYKVFSNSADAVKRYNIAVAASGNPARVAGKLTTVISCGLFKANAPNVRDAIQLVKDGRGEPFKPFGVPTIDDL